jgi:two-component system, NtrC family, sensor kinase
MRRGWKSDVVKPSGRKAAKRPSVTKGRAARHRSGKSQNGKASRLASELREALAQQSATLDVLKVINSSPGTLGPIFDAIVDHALQICDARFGGLWIVDGELARNASSRNVPQPYREFLAGQALPLAEAFGRGIQHEPFSHVADLAATESYRRRLPLTTASVELGGVRTYLAVPLRDSGALTGVLSVYRKEVRPFSPRQTVLLQGFAMQAEIAMKNARLFDEVQAKTRDLEESLQQQTATADVLKLISRSAFDLQTVLDALTETAVRLCTADAGSVWREEGDVFRAIGIYGFPDDITRLISATRLGRGRGTVTARTVLEGRPIHIVDVRKDPDFTWSEIVERAGLRAMLGVPLMRQGAPIGAFSLHRTEARPFTDKQIELVTTFADQAVIAIENTRLLKELHQRTDDLTKSLDELRTTQDRLVQTQKLALLGQLTAGIAHEIKNPLNFVNNFSGISAELIDELRDTLKGVSLDDKARAEIEELADLLKGNFDKVVHHGRRADAIIKNMLQHSREGSGEHRMIDINALVEESLNLAWHGARAETQGFEIKLKQSFDPSAGGADVFPQDIRRALLNLIANGFYATKRKAEANGGDYEQTLTASTKNLGDHVEIRIRDNGTGITADVKEKMFEPFFTTKPTGEGTGLGLSISHDIIVKQHAGTIEVETKPGAFTEIRIVLPRAPAFV